MSTPFFADRFELFILWSARLVVAVLVGGALIEGARTATFLRHSTAARGHVKSRASVTTDYPYDGYRGLRFVPVIAEWVQIEFVDSAGVAASEYVPEPMCWGVDESDIPIRFNFDCRPGIRVDTFFGLWGIPTLTLLAGVLIGAFVGLDVRHLRWSR